jgi:glycosyltransferase involved in cell wall biosynthesis
MTLSAEADWGQLRSDVRAALVQERWDLALRLIEADTWRTEDATAWSWLGWIYLQRGWAYEAEAAYRRGLVGDPGNEACVLRLVDLCLQRGLPYSALQVLRIAVNVSEPSPACQARLEQLGAQYPIERVSVFTPGYGCEEVIEGTLNSLRAQTYPIHEILLVDDKSPDRSTEIALRYGVRVFYNSENLGLAASCNTALANCTGDFLVKVDSDVVLDPTWIEQAMAEFKEAKIAGVGGRLIEHRTSSIPDQWRRFFLAQNWGPNYNADPAWIFGADGIFRVDCLKTIGGWNALFRKNFEDLDLSQRLKAAGYSIIYQPAALAHHLRRDNIDEVLDTSYNYAHNPQFLDGATYLNLAKAGAILPQTAGVAVQRLQRCLQEGRVELTYPSFLQFYWWCLRDVRQVGIRGKASAEVVSQTLCGVFLAIWRQLRNSGRVPGHVVARAVQDLRRRVRAFARGPELALLEADENLEAIVPCLLQTPEELFWAIRQHLPLADESYIKAFIGVNYLSNVGPSVGALLEVSVGALTEGETAEAEADSNRPAHVLFNPPSPNDSSGSKIPDAAVRWFSPVALESFAARLRDEGKRVFILDAAAKQLNEEEARERVLGMNPSAIIYLKPDSGLERILNSARRLKLMRPSMRLILLNANEALLSEAQCFPFFDAIYAGIPREGI